MEEHQPAVVFQFGDEYGKRVFQQQPDGRMLAIAAWTEDQAKRIVETDLRCTDCGAAHVGTLITNLPEALAFARAQKAHGLLFPQTGEILPC
jgi:hypothetical protein